jgi:hypothetical protein
VERNFALDHLTFALANLRHADRDPTGRSAERRCVLSKVARSTADSAIVPSAKRILLHGSKPVRAAAAPSAFWSRHSSEPEPSSGKLSLPHGLADTTVDEVALRVNIAALRKSLDGGRNGKSVHHHVPGRGYVFVAPATRDHAEPQSKV